MSVCILVFLGMAGASPLAVRAAKLHRLRNTEEPQSPPTFKTSVDLVSISAFVRDRHGRLVTTLKAADFEVFDKGERRAIVDFQFDRASPVAIAMLVDVSGSMRVGSKLAFARRVLEHLVAELHDGRDEVGLFTFDSVLHAEQPFTVHPAAIDSTLGDAQPFGSTSLYDAIAATARHLADRPLPRRAIVVFTDGVDTSSALTPAEVSGLASSIDVPVYIAVTVPPIDYALFVDREVSRTAQSAVDLRDLASWTGGDLLWATSQEGALVRAQQILAELRHQYLIAIESAGQPEWRPLDVRVRNRHLTVRTRSGYFSRETPVSK